MLVNKHRKLNICLTALLFVLLCCPSVVSAESNDQAGEGEGNDSSSAGGNNLVFQEALEQFKAKRFSTAARMFEQGLQDNPSNALARYYLGRAWEQTGRPIDDSYKQYQRAYSSDPNGQAGVKALARKTQIDELSEKRLSRIKAYIRSAYDVPIFGTTTLKIYGSNSGAYSGEAYSRYCMVINKYSYTLSRLSGEVLNNDLRVYIWSYNGAGYTNSGFTTNGKGSTLYGAKMKWVGTVLQISIDENPLDSSVSRKNFAFRTLSIGGEPGSIYYSGPRLDNVKSASDGQCKGRAPRA